MEETFPDYSTVRRNGTVINGTGLTVHGDRNTVTGFACKVHGDYNIVSGMRAEVHGKFNTVSGMNSSVHGNQNVVSGMAATVCGEGNTVSGLNSTAEGNQNNTISGSLLRLSGHWRGEGHSFVVMNGRIFAEEEPAEVIQVRLRGDDQETDDQTESCRICWTNQSCVMSTCCAARTTCVSCARGLYEGKKVGDVQCMNCRANVTQVFRVS